ncbi:MAG: hypothetical protein ACPGSN_04025 [Psychrobium sp.]
MDIDDLTQPDAELKYLRERMRASIAFGLGALLIAIYGLADDKTIKMLMIIFGISSAFVVMYSIIISQHIGKSMNKKDVDSRNYSDEYLNFIHHKAYKHAFDVTCVVTGFMWYWSTKEDDLMFSTQSCLALVIAALGLGYGLSVFYLFRKSA